jgi:hypothetical protein
VCTPFGVIVRGDPAYLVELNVNGSSLPNRSGTPDDRNLSVRRFDRSIASEIMSGVASVRGRLVVVDAAVDVVDALAVVSAVCADAGAPESAKAVTIAAPTIICRRGMDTWFIVVLPWISFVLNGIPINWYASLGLLRAGFPAS